MADNFPLTPGSGRSAATDQVTHSGDTADVQLVRVVGVTGAEGSKTVVDLPVDATLGVKTNPGGNVAHDAADSGNPVKIGMRAVDWAATPTAVAAGDRSDVLCSRGGMLFQIGGHPNVQTIRLQFTAAQTNVAVITVGSGTRIIVTSFQFTLDNASTVFPQVRLGFGTANTPTTTGVIGAHGGVPAGGGFGRGDGSGVIGIGGDDEDLRITTVGAATGNGCELVVTYFTAAV